MNYEIRVIESSTGRVIHTIKHKGYRESAEKVERGTMVNMNHDRYHTQIVEVN